MFPKRPTRLTGVSYVGYQRYFLTFCTARRHPAFESADLVETCLRQFRRAATAEAFAIVAYCFMPDHVHLVVCGMGEASDLQAFMISCKKVTGFEYSRRHRRRLWQPSYYDRVLRDDESTEAVVRYVLENPVRAGLAKEIGEYPFAGSDLYDATEVRTAWDRHV